jgi:hypothetical protein
MSIFGSVQWTGAFALGLCYVAAGLGVYLTFRVLNFPDLTIEGSFPLGACLAGILLAGAGWPHLGHAAGGDRRWRARGRGHRPPGDAPEDQWAAGVDSGDDRAV